MHAFPSDEETRKKCVDFVRQHCLDFQPTHYSALCSIHFEAQCFNRMFSLADLEGESGSTLTIVQYMQQTNLHKRNQALNAAIDK